MKKIILVLLIILMAAIVIYKQLDNKTAIKKDTADNKDITETNVEEKIISLSQQLQNHNMKLGMPVFIRAFKESSEMEVWLKTGETFEHFKTYAICRWSGTLGPKQKEGDRQTPEGFYNTTKDKLNPNSSYHLSFNIGFPNKFDRSLKRTGSYLMIHGSCVSIGCYAMTDKNIEEIYALVEASLKNQPKVPIHLFPFRMTKKRLQKETDNKWYSYWLNLKQGYDLFETNKIPPEYSSSLGKYEFK